MNFKRLGKISTVVGEEKFMEMQWKLGKIVEFMEKIIKFELVFK